jgi:hypothetical protein
MQFFKIIGQDQKAFILSANINRRHTSAGSGDRAHRP